MNKQPVITKEREAVEALVTSIVNNGVLDELVVAALETALDSSFEELERLYKKKCLDAPQWQDYAENLQFVHACLKVLRWFSMNLYDQEQVKANTYSLKIEELY
jgi:hypothetical protein